MHRHKSRRHLHSIPLLILPHAMVKDHVAQLTPVPLHSQISKYIRLEATHFGVGGRDNQCLIHRPRREVGRTFYGIIAAARIRQAPWHCPASPRTRPRGPAGYRQCPRHTTGRTRASRTLCQHGCPQGWSRAGSARPGRSPRARPGSRSTTQHRPGSRALGNDEPHPTAPA